MRFHNLQILRVLAAVGVVAFHLGHYARAMLHADGPLVEWLRTGPWAIFPVPLFFALSGFVLAHALRTAPRGRFLLARVLRLYPGYWVAVALVFPALWYAVWSAEVRQYVRPWHVGWALLPHERGTCFFPLGVEWSLVYEVVLSGAVAGLSLFGRRRGLPVAAGVWLAVLLVKAAVWPGYATEQLPTWGTVFLSAYNAPFLLGVLAYAARDVGRRWRWPVLAGTLLGVAAADGRTPSAEAAWLVYGAASAGLVWVAAQLRQVAETNPLARLGDCTYGLYLVHTPVIVGLFDLLPGRGAIGLPVALGVGAAAALALGLLYGRFETRMHTRLRPLAKVTAGDLRALPGRVRGRVVRVMTGRVGGRPRVQ